MRNILIIVAGIIVGSLVILLMNKLLKLDFNLAGALAISTVFALSAFVVLRARSGKS